MSCRLGRGMRPRPQNPLGDLPEPMKQAFEQLIRAAMAGEDVEPLVTELRGRLHEAAPGRETEMDGMLDGVVTELAGMKKGDDG